MIRTRTTSRILQRCCLTAAAVGCCLASTRPGVADEPKDRPTASKNKGEAKSEDREFKTEIIRGRVDWMADALVRRFEVTSVPEAQDRVLAIETPEGELHPLVENIRGRAFRRDPRLRDENLELVVRRYRGSPMVQVIRVYASQPDGLFELDYWCDICAITMYELKDCECCQGPIELRKTKVAAAKKD